MKVAQMFLGIIAVLILGTTSDFAEAKDGQSTQATTTFGEWSQPINIGPPLNTEYNDNYAVVTKNGLSIYFTSDRPGGFGGDDLWVSKRESVDSPWGDPENLGPIVNTQYADSLAVLDSSEHIMYFHSSRPGGCGEGDLWMSRRRGRVTDDNWSSPVNLGCIINTSATETAPAFYEDEETEQATLYFGSNRPGGIGDFDIYQSLLEEDDSFGSGVRVPELSSPKRDTRTFVRKDGREIFITSNRDGGVGLIDIWVSTRENPSATWSVPVNLGALVNSSSDDGSPALSKDGTTLYFFSNRPGGHGQRDIWFTVRNK
jgi:hypothetical protein